MGDFPGDLVLTPGGKRARALVRRVTPGEAVHVDTRGIGTVVREEELKWMTT